MTVAGAEEPERPAEDPAARARAKALIENLLKEREKIVSAIVHVRGSRAVARHDPPPGITIHALYAFDHSDGLFRFDDSKPRRSIKLPPGQSLAVLNDPFAAAMFCVPWRKRASNRWGGKQ